MYEDFRRDILLEMSKLFGEDSETMLKILGAVDSVATKYTIETKIQALVPPSELTAETMKLYLASLNVEGKAKGTIRNKYYCLKKFLEAVNIPLKCITTNDIRAYLYTVKQTTSESNEEKTRQHLLSFFDFCVEEEILDKNPMLKIRRIKTERKLIEPLNDEELAKLFAACENAYELALISFMYATGCRISEAASVKVSDIDFANNEVHLFGKGKKHRNAYLSDSAAKNIKEFLNNREYVTDVLFPNQFGQEKHQITAKALRDLIHRIAKRAGIKVNPHQIRHTTATNLQESMPIQMVSDYLGHENIATTMIYAKIDRRELKEKYKAVMDKETA